MDYNDGVVEFKVVEESKPDLQKKVIESDGDEDDKDASGES